VDYMLRKIRGGDPFPNEPRPELILDAMFRPRRKPPAAPIKQLAAEGDQPR